MKYILLFFPTIFPLFFCYIYRHKRGTSVLGIPHFKEKYNELDMKLSAFRETLDLLENEAKTDEIFCAQMREKSVEEGRFLQRLISELIEIHEENLSHPVKKKKLIKNSALEERLYSLRDTFDSLALHPMGYTELSEK